MGRAETASVAPARSGAWGVLKPTSSSPSAVQSWPSQVEGDMAWEPTDLDSGAYVLALTDVDVSEIREALEHFNGMSSVLP